MISKNYYTRIILPQRGVIKEVQTPFPSGRGQGVVKSEFLYK